MKGRIKLGKLIESLNDQMNFELQSAYVYLGMAAYFDSKDMGGFSHFMKKQAHEEFEHFDKFYSFLLEIDEKPEYEAMEKPVQEFGSFKEAFEKAYDHEKEVTRRINAIYETAAEEKDRRVTNFLDWFVKEQIEEEESFRGIVTRLERIGESWSGLYIFDGELANR